MANGRGDMWWEIKTPRQNWRPVSLDGINKLPALVREEVNGALKEVADNLLKEIQMAFHVAIRGGEGFRKRNAAYKGSSPMVLMQRMVPALTKQLISDKQMLGVLVFDLSYMDRITRGEGKKTWTRGWFLRFVDEHPGYKHGSRDWGFLPQSHARRLAEQCISMMRLDREKANALRQLVEQKFKGRHDEGEDEDGIMVKLDKPLFFEYPQFGKAEKYVRFHPGYFSWNIFSQAERTLQGDTVKDMLVAAIERAFERLE
jgi:hypothetical protein